MKYYFYCGVGAAKNGVWLTDSIFLIFGRGHIHIAHTPPLAPARPRIAALQPWAALRHAMQISRWFKDLNCIQLKEKILQWIQGLRRSWIL